MGIFSGSSPFDLDVEKATDEKNMSENWETILDVCDKVKAITTGPKDCLRAIIKRLYHQNPHVAKQAVKLLDACVSNCHKPFHLEIASRDSEQELYKLIKNKLHPQVASQLKQCLKKWAEGDFKTDSQLSLIPALYNRLRQEGVDFTETTEPVKKTVVNNKDVAAREEEDIAKAIALSLKEAEVTTKVSSSLYPSMTTSAPISPVKERERRKVRALYDFEAAEDNELTFKAGEIIHVIDDSDPNWWKGSNQRGEGLFPANFVSTDLEAEPEVMVARDTSKRVQFNEQVVVATLEETASSEAEVEIDEAKIDRMLHALHEADPTGERNDPEELKMLEDQCGAMGPLIDAELEKLDRRHAHLTKLGSHLIESLDMYRSLMREMPAPPQTHPNMNMGMPVHGYQYPGANVAPIGPVGGMNVSGNMKYPFPQPQAPPQSPSLAPFAPPVSHSATFPPNQVPNSMPYGVVNMGQQPFVNPYSGHPQNF